MGRYRTIGVNLNRDYRNDLNANFEQIEQDILAIDSKAIREELLAELARVESESKERDNALAKTNLESLLQSIENAKNAANDSAADAESKGNTAKSQGDKAEQQGNIAEEKANLAQTKADYANEKAIEADEAAGNAMQESSNLGSLKQAVVTATQDANSAADNADEKAAVASTQADYAKQMGDYAKQQGDLVEEIVDGTGFLTIDQKGAPGGLATLGPDGKVPDSQLNINIDTSTLATKEEAEAIDNDLQEFKGNINQEIEDVQTAQATHNEDMMYQIPNIVGSQIRINRLSGTNRLFFRLEQDLNGAITISTDNGATAKPLHDIEGNQINQLEKGFVEVVADANFFILRNKGGLSGTDKQALIDIVNESERNESDVKSGLITSLNSKVGSSLPTNAPWIDIQNAISGMSNKKQKTITINSEATKRSFTDHSGNSIALNFVSFNMNILDFIPSVVVVRAEDRSVIYETTWFKEDYYYTSPSNRANVVYSSSGVVCPYLNGIVYLPVQLASKNYVCMAFE